MALKIERLQSLEVPAARSETSLGVYSRDGYTLRFSPELTRTGLNYHGSLEKVPEGFRMATAADNYALDEAERREGRDPRQANHNDNVMGRKPYAWEWTSTALGVPEGAKPSDSFKEGGSEYWPREVIEGETKVGEMDVPQGGGRTVTEWDPVFGIPAQTTADHIPHHNHDTHFWFNSDLTEAAVGRRSNWLHGAGDWCLDVLAFYGRSDTYSDDGFRLVRGSIPEVEVRKIA